MPNPLDKSLDDEYLLIAAVLDDIHKSFQDQFDHRALSLTKSKIKTRMECEGMSFLTVTLPRLGKALDLALSDQQPLSATKLGFEPASPTVEYPKLLGELFRLVVSNSGVALMGADPRAVKCIRQVCYLFYKYQLPYTPELERKVVQLFVDCETDLDHTTTVIRWIGHLLTEQMTRRRHVEKGRARKGLAKYPTDGVDAVVVAHEARILLSNVLSGFDPMNILPSHGPGAVSTKERLWAKYGFTNVPSRLTDVYPLDAYFFASQGHVADRLSTLQGMGEVEFPARVCLVPKDSRGPRIISCEPLVHMWIQQGIRQALVEHIEQSFAGRLVLFRDQDPNAIAALCSSLSGISATLDLKEASDRVHLDLVRLLFPAHLVECMEACRSRSTRLPSGELLTLKKFAPMGSALCFPIMGLTIWSVLVAAARTVAWPGREQFRLDQILVYGDDVIVPTAFAEYAITALEAFGLKTNRDKSCIRGSFRESCGTDAFAGVNVTPVKLKTVWNASPSPTVYSSWIAYANLFWDRGYYTVYDRIVDMLWRVYPVIPEDGMIPDKRIISLRSVRADKLSAIKRRVNYGLQRLQYKVPCVVPRIIRRPIDGWLMLLRSFTEGRLAKQPADEDFDTSVALTEESEFSASSYTPRDSSALELRWR